MKDIKISDDFTTTEVRSVTLEVRDLQTSETVSSAVITHTPPSGSVMTIPFTVSTPYVYMLFGPFGVVGRHIINVQAVGSAATPSKPVTVFYFDVAAVWAGRK